MKVIYFHKLTWEEDFLQNDIFTKVNEKRKNDKLQVEFFQMNDKWRYENDQSIVNNNIFVINQDAPFWEVEDLVRKIKPLIIFHLSDEYGNLHEWLKLSQYTKLVIRQHNHGSYNLRTYQNILQIPVGYIKNFTSNRYSLDIQPKKINERRHNVSFIGQYKNDREHMCNVFRNHLDKVNINNVNNSWNINNLAVSPPDMFNVYNDSKFVLVGRGNHSLECFRIYEAIVAGAIPVIAGNLEEMRTTFSYNNYYNNQLPPFLLCSSWEEAVDKCRELLNQPAKLQELQDQNIQWWRKKVLEIQDRVLQVIDNK